VVVEAEEADVIVVAVEVAVADAAAAELVVQSVVAFEPADMANETDVSGCTLDLDARLYRVEVDEPIVAVVVEGVVVEEEPVAVAAAGMEKLADFERAAEVQSQ
jgi:hypothetical protein